MSIYFYTILSCIYKSLKENWVCGFETVIESIALLEVPVYWFNNVHVLIS